MKDKKTTSLSKQLMRGAEVYDVDKELYKVAMKLKYRVPRLRKGI